MPPGSEVAGTTSRTQFYPEGDSYVLQVKSSKARQRFPRVGNATNVVFGEADTGMAIEVLTGELNEFIAFELSLVPEVEYVFTALRDNIFYIWVVVDRFEQEVRERIYEREKAIIDEFSMFEFDFYIVSRMGRDAHDLISESVSLAYERAR